MLYRLASIQTTKLGDVEKKRQVSTAIEIAEGALGWIAQKEAVVTPFSPNRLNSSLRWTAIVMKWASTRSLWFWKRRGSLQARTDKILRKELGSMKGKLQPKHPNKISCHRSRQTKPTRQSIGDSICASAVVRSRLALADDTSAQGRGCHKIWDRVSQTAKMYVGAEDLVMMKLSAISEKTRLLSVISCNSSSCSAFSPLIVCKQIRSLFSFLSCQSQSQSQAIATKSRS